MPRYNYESRCTAKNPSASPRCYGQRTDSPTTPGLRLSDTTTGTPRHPNLGTFAPASYIQVSGPSRTPSSGMDSPSKHGRFLQELVHGYRRCGRAYECDLAERCRRAEVQQDGWLALERAIVPLTGGSPPDVVYRKGAVCTLL